VRPDGVTRGLVAVVFADLADSTGLLRELGDEAGEQVVRAALEVLRHWVRRSGGREVKALGDGLLIAFPTMTSALSAAAGMQHDLVRHNAGPGAVPVLLRVGVHAGEPLEDEAGDLIGLAVAVAQRLCDAATGGTILISETARGLLSTPEHALRPAGRLALKGVPERIGAYEVLWAGLPARSDRRTKAPTAESPAGGRPVLRTRLLPPRIPHGALPREELVAQVRHGLRNRLVTVVAGAGYGKSTLLAQGLAGLGQPTVWLSCDERVRTADAFVAHLIAGIEQHYPGVGERLSHHGSPEELVTALSNELVATVADEFVVVVDDAHVIVGHTAGEVLELLVRDLPPNVHVAVASRCALPSLGGRARAGGVVRIGEEALALGPEESEELVRRTRPGLTPQEAAELHRRTEGWVAGLLLAARAGPGAPARGGEDVFDFLAQEVLARQPDEVQRFLVDTAVFDRFTPALAEAVNGRAGAALVIQWLVENRLFCIPLEERGGEQWYRYHHLFQGFLRRLLRARDAEAVSELNRRAGSALLSAGEPLDAIPHLIAAGELGLVAATLEPLADHLLRSPHAGALREWLAAIPAPMRAERPGLMLAEASLLFLEARAEEAFEALDSAVGTFLRTGDHERAALVLARLMHARVGAGVGMTRGVEVAARYVRRIAPTARMLPVARILLAGGYGWLCRFDDAEQEMAEALALPGVERFPLARTYASVIRAHLIERIRGHVSEAPELLAGAVDQLEAAGPEDELGFLVHASSYRAFALSYVGRHEEALAEIERQARWAARTGQIPQAEMTAAWLRMEAFAALSRWDDLASAVDSASAGARLRESAVVYYCHAARARLLAQRGDPNGVLAELAAARASMEAVLGGVDFHALCELALAASAAGLSDQALSLARESHRVAAESSAAWGRARAALVMAHCDDAVEGDRGLAEALEITAEWGYEELWTRKERAIVPAQLARAIAGGLGPPGLAERLVSVCDGEVLESLLRDPRPAVRAAATRVHRRLRGGPRPPLRIEGLGGFIVCRGGVPIPGSAFGRDRARALLAALACARGPVPRERLLEWFWPGLSPDRGSRAFRTALHALRRALEPERARFDAGSVIRLDADVCRIVLEEDDGFDAEDFLRLARPPGGESATETVARLRSADALVRGALFPEWPYAEWAAELRTDLELAHRRVLAELAAGLLSVGDPRAGAECYERLLRLEPEREEWHRGRMRALADSGELALALRQYHVCRSVLQREIGIVPSEATRALYGELLARSG